MEIFKLLYANKLRLKRGKLLWIGLGVSLGYNILLLVMNYIELVSAVVLFDGGLFLPGLLQLFYWNRL